jgi:hypothetical protein
MKALLWIVVNLIEFTCLGDILYSLDIIFGVQRIVAKSSFQSLAYRLAITASTENLIGKAPCKH